MWRRTPYASYVNGGTVAPIGVGVGVGVGWPGSGEEDEDRGGGGEDITNGSILNPYSGKSIGVWILRALCVFEAEKRLKWTTRIWGARVMIIFFVATHSHLQYGHFQTSSPLSISSCV